MVLVYKICDIVTILGNNWWRQTYQRFSLSSSMPWFVVVVAQGVVKFLCYHSLLYCCSQPCRPTTKQNSMIGILIISHRSFNPDFNEQKTLVILTLWVAFYSSSIYYHDIQSRWDIYLDGIELSPHLSSHRCHYPHQMLIGQSDLWRVDMLDLIHSEDHRSC